MKLLYEDQATTAETVMATFRQKQPKILRLVVKAPCAWGKTAFAAACTQLCLDFDPLNTVAFFVPRIDLVDQTWISFKDDGIDAGVFQGDRAQDWSKRVQICSTHTCRKRKIWPDAAKLVIVDECHMQDNALREWLLRTGQRAIGLTATPGTKGMAKVYKTPRGDEPYWQTLIPGGNTAEMIKAGRLSDFRYFAPNFPDLKGVKTSVTAYGSDYNQEQLSERMNTAELHADIIDSYRKYWGKGKTLFFGVDCLHAQTVQKRFNDAGIPAGYQDAHTPRLGYFRDKDDPDGRWKKGDYVEGRNDIERKFHSGEYEIVCNVETLTTGLDWDVRCIQLGRPTKSEMLLVQICGRGGRLVDMEKIKARGDKMVEPKPNCLILDHTGTIGDNGVNGKDALGYPHLLDWDHLDTADPDAKSEPKPKKRLPKPCPKCAFLRDPGVLTCPACKFTPKIESGIHEIEGDMHEIKPGRLPDVSKNRKNVPSYAEKQARFRELKAYAELQSYRYGWELNTYRDMYGESPPKAWNSLPPANYVSSSTRKWITHRNIAWAKSRRNPHNSESRAGG